MLERHGGEVRAEGAPGRGAAFTFADPVWTETGKTRDGKENVTDKICTRPFAVDLNGDGKLDIVSGNFSGTFGFFAGDTAAIAELDESSGDAHLLAIRPGCEVAVRQRLGDERVLREVERGKDENDDGSVSHEAHAGRHEVEVRRVARRADARERIEHRDEMGLPRAGRKEDGRLGIGDQLAGEQAVDHCRLDVGGQPVAEADMEAIGAQ